MKKATNYYSQNFLMLELILSVIIAIALFTGIIFFKWDSVVFACLIKTQQALYGTLAAVFGALLGFVITGLSILLTTNNDSQGMQVLKESKHYKQIFTVFINTSRYLGIGTFISLVGLLSDNTIVTDFNKGISLIVFWCIIIVIFRISRCLWILEKIIDIIHPSKKQAQ